MASFSILTVCTGNICRSPLAEQLIRSGLEVEPEIELASAGTQALVGHHMPEQAQALARELGVTAPEQHVAQALTIEHLRDANLVIALSREHRRTIVEMYPRGARHTFTLRELERLLTGLDEDAFADVNALEPHDIAGRIGELVEIAASRRGTVIPPDSPDDDDVIDPYRRADSVYRQSAHEIVPAVATLVSQIQRVIAGRS